MLPSVVIATHIALEEVVTSLVRGIVLVVMDAILVELYTEGHTCTEMETNIIAIYLQTNTDIGIYYSK